MRRSLVSLVLLLCLAASPAAAVTVFTSGSTATGIQALPFQGNLVDVDFVFDEPQSAYSGMLDVSTQADALTAIDAIVGALNAEGGIAGVGPSDASLFIVGFDVVSSPTLRISQAVGFLNTQTQAWVNFNSVSDGAADQPITIARIGPSVVPAPAALPLLATGLAGLALVARRRRSGSALTAARHWQRLRIEASAAAV